MENDAKSDKTDVSAISLGEHNSPRPLEERILRKIEVRLINEHRNLENIIEEAKMNLINEEIPVAISDYISSDFFHRFFEYAEKVYDEDAQILWAKILSDSIKKPGSYSLRTISLLHNITYTEAQLFKRASAFITWVSSDPSNPFIIADHKSIRTRAGLSMSDISTLEEIGVLNTHSKISLKIGSGQHTVRIGKNIHLLVSVKKTVKCDILPITKSGQEILHLFEIEKADSTYCKNLITYLTDLWHDKAKVEWQHPTL